MRDKVFAVLDKIRPSSIAAGGNVQTIDVSNGIFKVRLTAFNFQV